MTYKEKVSNDYGIDPTHLACPCDLFNKAYDCFADDNNENLSCEDCWNRDYKGESYCGMILFIDE